MIFPEPREDRLHQKGIAFISTLVFAVLGFVFLSISDIQIQNASREVFRKIDMSSLMPASLRLSTIELNEVSSVDTNVRLYGMASTAGDSNIPSESGEGDEAPNSSEYQSDQEERENRVEQPAAPQPQETEIKPETATTPPPNPQPAARVDDSSEDAISDPAQPVEENTRPVTSPALSSSNNEVAEGSVPRLPLEAFGNDYKSLEVRGIISWMRNNPAELPKGIRQLVRFRPAFLSSVTSFTMDGKDYELYLMCKESLFEVHVVLVENNEATYLVDRSFQKLSTYLRKGQVRRTQDNQIIAVRSNMASNDSSDEFYSLFLSWWDWAK